MGGYIPSYWDNQIRAALNGRFSDTTIPAGDPAYVHGHTESFMGPDDASSRRREHV